MKHFIIINTQAVGDCLLGTHTAKHIKKLNPNCFVTFLVRDNLVPTTGESDMNDGVALKLLSMQEGIDAVGYVTRDNKIKTSVAIPDFITDVYEQSSWYSDLGIALSQHFSYNTKNPDNKILDTETKFNVGAKKELPHNKLSITTSGPLDWNRKIKNDKVRVSTIDKIKKYLNDKSVNYEITFLGRDVEQEDLVTSLQRLNNSHIYIGPMGLPVHAAAGLDVDTIYITSVFPAKYDGPDNYHSGWHRPVKSKIHCGTYSCVSEKKHSDQVYPEGPPTKFGFWPKLCPYTSNKMSCVYNTDPEDILFLFDQWFQTKGKDIWKITL